MISRLKLVNLTTEADNLYKLLNNFVTFKGFHPIDPDRIVSTVHGTQAFESSNPCEPLLAEIKEIENLVDTSFESKKIACYVSDIDDIQIFVDESHQKIMELHQQIKSLEQEKEKIQEALFQVKNIEDFGVEFDDIFGAKYVAIRFGKLPSDVADRIRFYKHKPFIFVPFVEKDGVIWSMYMTTKDYEREIDNIFTSMFFERIYIPDFVHGTPEKAKQSLEDETKQIDEKIDSLKASIKAYVLDSESRFDEVKGELQFLSDIYSSRQYVVRLGERITLTGFIEADSTNRLQHHFETIPNIEIEIQEATADKRFNPPTKLKNHWLTKPFEFFVNMYGVPSYKDIDPTLMVAITYSLLFGIMFGDLGQGLVLVGIGMLLSKFTTNVMGPILTRVGVFSAIFGVIYGETFGQKSFLDPFYHWISGWLGTEIHPIHPMDNSVTMNLLIATVGIGSFIILSVITINTIVRFKNKDTANALFSANGLAGLIFYGFVLSGILMQMLLGVENVFNPFTNIVFIFSPILLIFMKEPLERKLHHEPLFPDGLGGFLIEGIFELFEVLLSYVTNSLSFLRVGGFVLSHAGMMLVVNTLMEMSSGASVLIVAIIGNLFVMALEGLIVGIQVMRLEFYEMFSRYFEGDGIAFNSRF